MELRGSVFQWPADRPWTSRGILFVLGCLMTTAFAPFGLSLLVPVLLLPVLYVYLSVPPPTSGSRTIAIAIARCRPSVRIATRIAAVPSMAMNDTP